MTVAAAVVGEITGIGALIAVESFGGATNGVNSSRHSSAVSDQRMTRMGGMMVVTGSHEGMDEFVEDTVEDFREGVIGG